MYCELTNSHCTFIHLVPCFHLHAFLLIPSFSASLPSATKGLWNFKPPRENLHEKVIPYMWTMNGVYPNWVSANECYINGKFITLKFWLKFKIVVVMMGQKVLAPPSLLSRIHKVPTREWIHLLWFIFEKLVFCILFCWTPFIHSCIRLDKRMDMKYQTELYASIWLPFEIYRSIS